MCAVAPAWAQTPAVLWAISAYGPGNTQANIGAGGLATDKRAIARDAAGNVVVSGISGDPLGASEWKTVKFDGATGGVMWEKPFNNGGAPYNQAYAMTLDAAGNAIVTGYEWNGTDGDIKTIKYAAADGAILWQKTVAGVAFGNDFGIYVATDASGNAIVGGSTSNGSNDDMRTVKYASFDGEVLWDKTFAGPGNGNDYVFALALDSAGNVFVTGESQTVSDPDWKTIKYAAADGAILWEKVFAGSASGLDIPLGIAIDGAGNPVVAGHTFNGTNSDMKIIKYAAVDGAILWQNGFAGAGDGDDFFYDVALDKFGNAIATGFSFNGLDNDWKTIKFAASNGAIRWEKTFAGAGNGSDVATAVAIDQGGNAIVGGRSFNGVDRDLKVIAYAAKDGAPLWQYDYAGSGADFDRAAALAIAPGAVFVAGESTESSFPLGWRIVKLENTSVSLSATGPIRPGQQSIITAVVSGDTGTPTGSVLVTGAGTGCSITLAGGAGSCLLTPTIAGSGQTLTGNYGGDGIHAAGSGATELTINATLDVDQSDTTDALTDGLLVLRYLFGLRGPAMTAGAIASTAYVTDPTAIADYLTNVLPLLDIDGVDGADALTDGLLVIRYLFGLRGASLIQGAVGVGATRSTAPDIEAYIESLLLP
ncbi:MAG: PQQ-binding-like beta-propeller repeat protein [Betaproteobacteria bacterium]